MSEGSLNTLLMLAAIVSAVCAVIAAWVSVAVWRKMRSSNLPEVIARIEARQQSEEQHVLRPRDLDAIHEKVNKVAQELAATRGQVHTETRMLSEQLRVLQQLVQQGLVISNRKVGS